MKSRRFEVSDYLQDEAAVSLYLEEAAKMAAVEGDSSILLGAIADAARARGMMTLAKEAGVSRESLYKSLAPDAKPRFETVAKILNALGVQLAITPVKKEVLAEHGQSTF